MNNFFLYSLDEGANLSLSDLSENMTAAFEESIDINDEVLACGMQAAENSTEMDVSYLIGFLEPDMDDENQSENPVEVDVTHIIESLEPGLQEEKKEGGNAVAMDVCRPGNFREPEDTVAMDLSRAGTSSRESKLEIKEESENAVAMDLSRAGVSRGPKLREVKKEPEDAVASDLCQPGTSSREPKSEAGKKEPENADRNEARNNADDAAASGAKDEANNADEGKEVKEPRDPVCIVMEFIKVKIGEITQIMNIIVEADPDDRRGKKVKRDMKKALNPYEEPKEEKVRRRSPRKPQAKRCRWQFQF